MFLKSRVKGGGRRQKTLQASQEEGLGLVTNVLLEREKSRNSQNSKFPMGPNEEIVPFQQSQSLGNFGWDFENENLELEKEI